MRLQIRNEKSASVADCWSRGGWLKTDFVVDCISESLLAAEVPFRCLMADVTDQELNITRKAAAARWGKKESP